MLEFPNWCWYSWWFDSQTCPISAFYVTYLRLRGHWGLGWFQYGLVVTHAKSHWSLKALRLMTLLEAKRTLELPDRLRFLMTFLVISIWFDGHTCQISAFYIEFEVEVWRIILIRPNCRIFRNEYSDSRITNRIFDDSDSVLRITKWSYKNSDSWQSVFIKFVKIRQNPNLFMSTLRIFILKILIFMIL